MSESKVWIVGAQHSNADRSISWDEPFPNFTEPDVLIINLVTLDKETLQRLNKEKLDQAASFIKDKFLNRGIIIFITAPNFDITDNQYIYSNYVLSPIKAYTKNVPQGTRIKYHEKYDFIEYLKHVKAFDFYIEGFDPNYINYIFEHSGNNVKALELVNQELKDNGGHSLGSTFSLFQITRTGTEYRKDSGQVIFLPPPTESMEDTLSTLLIILGKTTIEKETPPDWISKINLPLVSEKLDEIQKLETQKMAIQDKINNLEKEKSEILNFCKLLYSKNTELEDIVFEAFKLLGFKEITRIRELDREDWIFNFKYEKQFKYGIIEVKGADTRTKQQHIVQTSKWVDERYEIDKKISKGIFIPNQFRLIEYPKSKKQREQFEPNELQYANMKSICIIPSFVLFEAIKNALEGNSKSREEIEKIIATNSGVVSKI